MFIAFEGMDGTGKSTQARMLYNALKKKNKAILTEEPTDGEIGKLVKMLISKSNAKYDAMALQLMFTADRADHVNSVIMPMLKKGYTVITDRYYFSTIVYGTAAGLDEKWLYHINSVFPYPDYVFIIDGKPEECLKRIDERGERSYFEKLAVLKKIRKSYKLLSKKYKNCHLIDGKGSPDKVAERILKILYS